MKAGARYRLRAHMPEAAASLTAFDKHIDTYGPAAFMVIKVGGGILDQEGPINSFSSSVAELADVGLTPMVVHGGNPQISRRLEAAGIRAKTKDGLRVTSEDAIPYVAEALDEVNSTLVEKLKAKGHIAIGLTRTFEAKPLNEVKYGKVGRAVGIDGQPILAALDRNQVPVISSMGRDASSGELLNVNGDDAAAQLVRVFRPLKYLSVTTAGGVRMKHEDGGGVISEINPEEVDELQDRGIISGRMLVKARAGAELVKTGLATEVVIVSPYNILAELFTDKGRGTLIKNRYP